MNGQVRETSAKRGPTASEALEASVAQVAFTSRKRLRRNPLVPGDLASPGIAVRSRLWEGENPAEEVGCWVFEKLARVYKLSRLNSRKTVRQ